MKVDIGNVKLARREFLKITSASAVGGTLVGASATIKPLPRFSLTALAAAATTAAPRVAIGYWDGRLASSFVDATEVAATNGRAATSARVTVAAGCEPEAFKTWAGYRSAGLSLDLRPSHDGALHVWRHQAHPVPGGSPLASFDVPLDGSGGLSGWVDYRAADGVAMVPFQIGAEGLRSGAYLITLAKPGSLGNVDWSGLRLRVIDGGNALELRDDRDHLVRQPHIVVEVHLT
ncbi:MAG TPA: hypothetical protein PKA95_08590 [Thermomicrobiales bacterium]|nr:hypothetical protein [Thermomicrobiales bacterium]